MKAELPMYLLTPPMGQRATGCTAAELVGAVLDGALARGAPSLVIAPAGLVSVETEDEALEQAEAIRLIARRTGIALLFGIDVGPPQPGSGRIFACFGGAPVLWPAPTSRTFPADAAHRLLRLGDRLLLPLYASEALDPVAPARIAALGGVTSTLVLSHGGATQRWAAALARLEKVAPVAVALHHGGTGRGYASPRLGVSWLSVGTSAPSAAAA